MSIQITLLFSLVAFASVIANAEDPLPSLTEVAVTSTLDGEQQPVLYWAPEQAKRQPTVLFVFLHSWSGNYKQDNSKWQIEAVRRGWIYLHPNFRGANNSPKACGSRFARQDILDAIDFAHQQFHVDKSRVYLAGVSGGGHMAMLMAGHHSDRFSAVSAWVGISDLAAWYRFHLKDGEPQKYAQMILKSLGGPPGASALIDADYVDRSPVHHLHNSADLPLDIFAGVNDGHAGSVPVRHSLTAFNRIAKVNGTEPISGPEMEQLWNNRRLTTPRASDSEVDPVLGRDIKLRRESKKSRVTIFEGGHESIPESAIGWLQRQRRMTR